MNPQKGREDAPGVYRKYKNVLWSELFNKHVVQPRQDNAPNKSINKCPDGTYERSSKGSIISEVQLSDPSNKFTPIRRKRYQKSNKHNANWLNEEVGKLMELDILVWRSVGVRFLKAYIHPQLGGGWLLRHLYWLEERYPHYMGEHGLYPLIILKKS